MATTPPSLRRVLDLLGTEPDGDLDRLAALAGRLVGSRVSLVSVVHPGESQHFLGESGLASVGFPGARATPIEQSICQNVTAADSPLSFDDAVADPRLGPDHGAVRDLGVGAYAGVPLHADGEAVGALCAIETGPREWSHEDLEILADLAATAEALLAARLSARRAEALALRERHDSELLQQALLPDALPKVDGLRIAAAYRPAETIAGGDWYEVLPLPGDRRVAFALGDVVGHGVTAAAAAGRLRTAFQVGLLADVPPGVALERLNDLANLRGALAYSSVVSGDLDLGTGELRLASAGHPPPVVVRGGEARRETPADNPVLAAHPARTPFATRTSTLARGDGLVLYSDGLIEDRGDDRARDERLRRVVEDAWGHPARVVAAALDALRPVPGPDDVAVLVLQRD